MSDSSKLATERSSEDMQLAEELVERARSEGVDLVGADLLQRGENHKKVMASDKLEFVVREVEYGMSRLL